MNLLNYFKLFNLAFNTLYVNNWFELKLESIHDLNAKYNSFYNNNTLEKKISIDIYCIQNTNFCKILIKKVYKA